MRSGNVVKVGALFHCQTFTPFGQVHDCFLMADMTNRYMIKEICNERYLYNLSCLIYQSERVQSQFPKHTVLVQSFYKFAILYSKLQSIAEKVDFFAFHFINKQYSKSLKPSKMLLKTPDSLKTSQNQYETHLILLLFQTKRLISTLLHT